MSSLRLQRVRELLKRELGEIIRREVPVGAACLITVNEITLSSDLQAATAHIGILGDDEQKKRALAELNQRRGRIQALVGKAVILKYTPQLRFLLDQSIEEGNRVLQIIEELEHAAPPDETTPKDH